MTRHPVRVEYDGPEAIFALAALRRNISWLEGLTPDDSVVPTVLAVLRRAAEKLDKATYGDPTLADGEFYAGMPTRCTCSQSMTARHAPGCLLSENVRGWDDTRATESELRVMDGNR